MSGNLYADYVLDLLFPLGGIVAKKMFGGVGFYKDGIFFALIAEGILYFKVDDVMQSTYKKYDSKPFSYEGKNNKKIVMSYWEVPVDILEHQEKLSQWASQAVLAAKRAKKS